MSSAAYAQSADFFGYEDSANDAQNPVALYLRLSREKGGLIPQAMLVDALGVTSGRISELIRNHRFEVHQIAGRNYITADSFEAYLVEEKRTGRGHKAPTMRTLIHAAFKASKGKE